MPHIVYNPENCMKCQCAGCPVQAMSQCTMSKRPKWNEMRMKMQEMMKGGGMSMDPPGMGAAQPAENMPEEMGMGQMEMLEPSEMIGLYCSSEIGKSTCGDLDASQECVCPSCEVWTDNGLRSRHYCTEGDADQRG